MARTPNYNLELIDFDTIPWHEKEHDNWSTIDAVFANFISINSMQGVWQNALAITVGQRFVDPEEGTIYTALVAHTSPSTGLFAASRTAIPANWEVFSDVALAESWATSLNGLVLSTDYSSKAYALGTLAQLPTGSAKRWAIEVEDTEVITNSYSALHHATKAAASAVLTAADLVATNQDTIDTAADLVQTAADVVLTNADVVLTHADEVLTRADTVLTAADVVSTNADVVTTAANVVLAQAAAYGWTTVTDITAATTNLETTDARKYYILDATSNTIAINLPAIGANEGIVYGFEVKNVDNAITLVRDGTDYINGVNGNYSGLVSVNDIVYVTSDDNSPDNWLVTFVSRVPTATSTTEGKVELATNAEVATGTDTGRVVTPAGAAAHYSPEARTITADTSTALNSALTHEGGVVTMNNGSANVFTIEPNATIAHSTGAQIDVIMLGAGVTSITADTGVTLNGVSAGTGAMTAQYGAVTLLRISSDVWTASGAIGTVA
jgi:hypothetical protein